MEKTNELNKFLSYMHMGNTIYRIYLEHAKKLENEKLIHLIIIFYLISPELSI